MHDSCCCAVTMHRRPCSRRRDASSVPAVAPPYRGIFCAALAVAICFCRCSVVSLHSLALFASFACSVPALALPLRCMLWPALAVAMHAYSALLSPSRCTLCPCRCFAIAMHSLRCSRRRDACSVTAVCSHLRDACSVAVVPPLRCTVCFPRL